LEGDYLRKFFKFRPDEKLFGDKFLFLFLFKLFESFNSPIFLTVLNSQGLPKNFWGENISGERLTFFFYEFFSDRLEKW